MRVATAQSNFSGGEFSVRFQGRIDDQAHPTGLSTLVNWIVPIQGCAYRRPGTRFVNFTGDLSSASFLVPFEFSQNQAFVVEFGHLFCRFYKDGAIVNANRTITGITKANPAVVTSVGHQFQTGQEVTISGVSGMTQINGTDTLVGAVTANTFELQFINSTSFSTYTSGGTAKGIYEITTPYADVDLFGLKVAQSIDTLYIAHPFYAQRKLARIATDNWTLSKIAFQDGPYLDPATAGTMTPSATTGNITLTASVATFASTDVGRLVRVTHGTTSGCAQITAFSSATVVSATVQTGFPFGGTTASSNWRLGVWSDTTGYPACVVFFQDRLVWGGSSAFPQRIDMSVSSNYETYSPNKDDGDNSITDANAISLLLNSNSVQDVRGIIADSKGLLVFTGTGEWIIQAATTGGPVTPSSLNAHQEGADGSSEIAPLRVGNASLYLQRAGRKIKEFQFYFDQQGFRSQDLTFMSDHITESSLTQMAFMREPDPILWCVRGDGQLAAMTYVREVDNLRATWHRHIVGGVSTASGLPARVESVAVIPSANGGYELWLEVQRFINGAVERMIERMDPPFDPLTGQHEAYFVDCGLERIGSVDIASVATENPVSILTVEPHGLSNTDTIFVVEIVGTTDLNSKVFATPAISHTVTIAIGSGNIVTWAGHPFKQGDAVVFSTTGSLPSPLVAGTTYYALFPDANTFGLSSVPLSGSITTSGSQSGVHTATATYRIQLVGVNGTNFLPYKAGGRLAKRISSLQGYNHLISQPVQILGDGGVQSATVANDGHGTVNLTSPAGFIIAGLGYSSDLQTLRFEAGAHAGVALGQMQRIDYLELFVDRTLGIQAGRDFDHLSDCMDRNTGDPMGVAPPLVSGVVLCENFEPDYTRDAFVCLRQATPLPATILAILPSLDTKERE